MQDTAICHVNHRIVMISGNVFIPSPDFKCTVNRFMTNLFTSFPDIPCAYCGILSVHQTIKWLEEEEVSSHAHLFGLLHVLHVPLHRDNRDRVAVCALCR